VYTRLTDFRKLLTDDFLAITAWILLFATAILWQIEAPALYLQYRVQTGEAPFGEFMDKYAVFIKFIVPFTILFCCYLWCVKFSFPVFFYKLGSKIRNQIWWCVVLIATTAALIASIADIDYRCSLGGFANIFGKYT
jgi:hypothetical protein